MNKRLRTSVVVLGLTVLIGGVITVIQYDKDTYKERHLIESFFNRVKQYRRWATRYDKTASMFKAFFGVDFDKDVAQIGLRIGSNQSN
ncbi:hypothetical protein [Paenibacillus sp. FSL L8-0502]|uniref:hypothetical protein n=1 Tax=Paenibacillus sp. FSL L8-0502 TaxID=2954619 RepID=UPI00315833B4